MCIALLAHTNAAVGQCTVSCCSSSGGCYGTETGPCNEVNCLWANPCDPGDTCIPGGSCTAPKNCCTDPLGTCCEVMDPICCKAQGGTVAIGTVCHEWTCDCDPDLNPDAECDEEEVISSEAPEYVIDTPAEEAEAEEELEAETGSGGWLAVAIAGAVFLVLPFARSRYRRRN